MGSISEKDGSFSIPLAYSMYYIWGTRILYGPFTSEFAILPFAGNWKTAGLHRKALEYSFLPQSVQTNPSKSGKAGHTAKIEISCDDDIIMTALYPENGNVVARFFRSADMSPVTRLKLKIGEYKLSETRLDGSPVGDFKEESAFTPWQIKTFRTKSR